MSLAHATRNSLITQIFYKSVQEETAQVQCITVQKTKRQLTVVPYHQHRDRS